MLLTPGLSAASPHVAASLRAGRAKPLPGLIADDRLMHEGLLRRYPEDCIRECRLSGRFTLIIDNLYVHCVLLACLRGSRRLHCRANRNEGTRSTRNRTLYQQNVLIRYNSDDL